MNLNCGCVLKYFVLVYSGLCWVLNKICRFKCGNNNKSETALKKNSVLGLGSYQNRSKKCTFGLGCTQNRGQKVIEFFFFKKEAHMASGASKTEAKRVSKKPIWPRVYLKPRPKGYQIKKKKKKPIWPRVERKTEAEGDSMASVLNRGKKL